MRSRRIRPMVTIACVVIALLVLAQRRPAATHQPTRTFLPGGGIDFNGDGRADVIRYSHESGAWNVALGTGTGNFSAGPAGSFSVDYSVQPANFDGDGRTDLFLYKRANGQWARQYATPAGFRSETGTWSGGWRTYVLDLSGDGLSDVFLHNVSTGVWFKALTVRGQPEFFYYAGAWSPGWELYPAEFEGDGRGDFFLYNGDTGDWFRASSDTAGGFAYVGGRWSPNWSIIPGDFDGDGAADIFLYSYSTGAWFIATPAGQDFSYIQGTWSPYWSLRAGDFNGDGLTDLFLYNPAGGAWFEAMNGGGGAFTTYPGTWSPWWDIQVADLNADRKSDLVLYDASTGTWVQALATTPGAFVYGSGTWARRLTVVGGASPPPPDRDVVFIPDAGIRVNQASNPAAGVDPRGTAYLYYEDRFSSPSQQRVAIAADGLTFEAGAAVTTHAYNSRRTLLPSGGWRIYVGSSMSNTLTSRFSTDGLTFAIEPGVRYTAEAAQFGVYNAFADSRGGVVLLYLADLMGENNVRRAYSTDDGVTYTFDRGDVLGDLELETSRTYVDPKTLGLGDSRLRLFTMRQNVIYSFIGDIDGQVFNLEPGTRLTTADFPDVAATSLNDPIVVTLPDGSHRMYVAALISDPAPAHWAILSARARAR